MNSNFHSIIKKLNYQQQYQLNNGEQVVIDVPLADDAASIVQCVNRAYLEKEGWFKYEQFRERIALEQVSSMITNQDLSDEVLLCMRTKKEKELVGVVCVQLVESDRGATDLYFGMLSATRKYCGKGFGTILLNDFLPRFAREMLCHFLDCKVSHVSEPLIRWYHKHSFEKYGVADWPSEIAHFLQVPVHFICLRKGV